MADFGGFDMPLWYETGIKNEHLGVLKSAGLFDTSHMACININGKDSLELLNSCFTRDITSLTVGRCVYGAFLNEDGHCIDDAIIYKFTDSFFMICVNACMGDTIVKHLTSNTESLNVKMEDLTGKLAKIDIQGKNSARVLSKIIKNCDSVFTAMPYFSFKGHFDDSKFSQMQPYKTRSYKSRVQLLNGTPILLSRSGYTGEFGFEIFINPDSIVKLWEDILKQGEEFGITACGLASRDSLRAGACLPLSHQDIGDWKFINHPWEFALPFNQDKTEFTKNFIGSNALLSQDNESYIYPFISDSLRKVSPGKETQVIDPDGKIIGHVLTCVTDMGIAMYNEEIISINSKDIPEGFKIKGLSCGFIMVSTDYGDSRDQNINLTLKEGKRSIKVKIVKDIRPDRTARKALNNFI